MLMETIDQNKNKPEPQDLTDFLDEQEMSVGLYMDSLTE